MLSARGKDTLGGPHRHCGHSELNRAHSKADLRLFESHRKAS